MTISNESTFEETFSVRKTIKPQNISLPDIIGNVVGLLHFPWDLKSKCE